MNKVVIFGVGDFAQVAHVYLTRDSEHDVAGFTVHSTYITSPTLLGLPVVPFEKLASHFSPDEYSMFIAVGFRKLNRARTEIYDICKALGYQLITFVSSKATHWGSIGIGDNCFVFENNIIQPFVTIGNNVIIWCGNHIGHHSRIGNNCFIASHAVIPGHVTIGDNCFIGVNATLRDGITVAPNCIIGAGTLILKDTSPNEVYKAARTRPSDHHSDELAF